MASQAKVIEVLASMCLLYPFPPGTAAEMALLQRLWHEDLADVPDNILQAAVAHYRRSGERFRPPPGVLRDIARQMAQGGPDDLASREAWAKVMGANFNPGKVDDPMALQAMNLIGGFKAFGESETDKQGIWKTDFLKTYKLLRQTAGGQMALGAGNHAATKRIGEGSVGSD
jgi:hypothetical protein